MNLREQLEQVILDSGPNLEYKRLPEFDTEKIKEVAVVSIEWGGLIDRVLALFAKWVEGLPKMSDDEIIPIYSKAIQDDLRGSNWLRHNVVAGLYAVAKAERDHIIRELVKGEG